MMHGQKNIKISTVVAMQLYGIRLLLKESNFGIQEGEYYSCCPVCWGGGGGM